MFKLGSKFAYVGKTETEEVSEEELESGYEASRNQKKRTTQSRTPKVRFNAATTNVFVLALKALGEKVSIFTGDPVACNSCHALLNAKSKLYSKEEASKVFLPTTSSTSTTSATTEASPSQTTLPSTIAQNLSDGQQLWSCEFCSHPNVVNLASEEIPTSSTLDYILEPAPVSTTQNSDSSSSIIFCLDTSGSMCVSTEVVGKFQLKGKAEAARKELLRQFSQQEGEQFLPQWNSNVTYVSRLQCVQAAVDAQLDLLAKEAPQTKVGIITFSNDVCVVGDGKQEPKTIAGDQLSNHDALVDFGKNYNLQESIVNSKNALVDRLWELEEGGKTALGPALVVALSMASKTPGSKVIVCTDGLANVGLGSIDYKKEELGAVVDSIEGFYKGLGTLGKEKGVMINVVSIKGEGCALESLGTLADLTSGAVDMVDPTSLTTNFQAILANPVLATNASATILLHRGLSFAGDLGEDEEKNNSNTLKKQIGNVTAESEVSFEYEFSKDGELKLKEVPFQVQLHYTARDGSKALRVETVMVPVTTDKQEAEKNIDVGVCGVRAIQTGAKLAQRGAYEEARMVTFSNQQMMSRVLDIPGQQVDQEMASGYFHQAEELDSKLRKQQKKEKSSPTPVATNSYSAFTDFSYKSNRSDDSSSNSNNLLAPPPSPSSAFVSPSAAVRKVDRYEEDETSNTLWKAKSMNTNSLKKK